MPTIDLGVSPPAPAGTGLSDLPRRLTLTLPELELVAEYAGGAPLPFPPVASAAGPGLGARLGRTQSATDADAFAAALARLHDPRASLARRGLLVDTVVDEGLLGAVGLLATPSVALDLDVTAGGARVRAWHRQRAGAVATLSTADGIVFELAWFAMDRWRGELGRVAVLPDGLDLHPSGVPDAELPYALLDAAGEAARTGRPDLIPVLVAGEDGAALGVDGTLLDDVAVQSLLAALTSESRGRLRVLAADVSGEETTVVGVVSWVLLADGWRALRPQRIDDVDRVALHRVTPADLPGELAPVLAEVTR